MLQPVVIPDLLLFYKYLTHTFDKIFVYFQY